MKLKVSYRRSDGVTGYLIPTTDKRFKELWSYFKSRWLFCELWCFNDGGRVIENWQWTKSDGWIRL